MRHAIAGAMICTALSCSSARPPESSVHQTFETADVGLYTGGWPDGGAAPAAGDGAAPTGDAGTAALGAGAAGGTCGSPGRVCGVAETTHGYCGGPAISDEMREQMARPTPAVDLGLLVREGDVNADDAPVVTQTRTDAAGNFVFDLPQGTWCIVEESKASLDTAAASAGGPADPACLQQWLRTCDLTITVGDQPLPAAVLQFARGCGSNPCVAPLAYP